MAVAHDQTLGVYRVLRMHVSAEKLRAMLRDLHETAAYERNISFQQTVDRLQKLVEEKG